MNHIRILTENVASQIAAGEVVERPASVVRELMDNSIDAGAKRILASVQNGGKTYIKVNDDGSGMSRDDLLLCVERHATSKIKSVSDLFAVKTLGFRGEALPSIASVSKMVITTRPARDLAGCRFKIAGGKPLSIEETGCPPGTAVVVRDLFYNLPARRKFLKGPGTEMDHIIDIVSRWALPYSEIEFRLDSHDRILLHFPASGDPIFRLANLLGRKVAESMVEAHEKGPGLEIKAYLAPWEFSRNRGDRLYFYVNGRNIRDRFIARAIVDGYGQRLMKGQYPQAIVFIDMDPSQVDVNVHPTKQEIRFSDGRALFGKIASVVEKSMSGAFQVFLDSEFHEEPPVPPLFTHEPSQGSYQPSYPSRGVKSAPTPQMMRDEPRIIGNLGNTYILCQAKDGLLMVDQHAAHERVLYEELKNGLSKGGLQIQTLLIPQKLEFSLSETKILLEKGGWLSGFGIELDHFGGNSFLLRSVPALLERVNWEDFLSEMISEVGKGTLEEHRSVDEGVMVMACHGAIRAGHALSSEEMSHLLHQLMEMDLPSNCPHGRPIFRYLHYREIEKMFRRLV